MNFEDKNDFRHAPDEAESLDLETRLDSTRREVLKASVAGAALAGALAVSGCSPGEESGGEDSETDGISDRAQTRKGITAADIEGAERVMGVSYTPAERAQILEGFDSQIDAALSVRDLQIPNHVAPALAFDPRMPGKDYGEQASQVSVATAPGALPSSKTDIAFAPLTHLSHWLRTGAISSRDLTELYLSRIAEHAPKLECFVTVTDDLARGQADKADREIAAGNYRGPLHGVPYGLKDLMDTANIRTSWGAMPYKDRVAETDGAVTRKLRDAGAVLLGKTTLGAIAYGDIWFGGKTRNPWNLEEGSSGSSAGSASATAAGLVGFAIGTETLGSIVSPSNRCGATGLRPTFGRVSRVGAMALCWSLDKIGPICRSVEDTALVLAAINGYDAADASSIDMGFAYDGSKSIAGARVGYVPDWFGDDASPIDHAGFAAARKIGVELVEVELPDLPYGALVQQLMVEAASAFEELTLSGRDDQMVWQDPGAWPNGWRSARMVSAVDLVNIDRFRRQVMNMMDAMFDGVDAMIGPNYAGGMLTITNYTGHPQLALRAGFQDLPTRVRGGEPAGPDAPKHRVPGAFSVWGPLFGEEIVLNIGRALEIELGVTAERPPGFA